jgi:small neutral amino acid transporter SnatA (MarC family)
MSLDILPLAITMMAGPQIMSAIIFVTAPKPLKTSASFIVGVAVATTVGVAIALALASVLDNSVSPLNLLLLAHTHRPISHSSSSLRENRTPRSVR